MKIPGAGKDFRDGADVPFEWMWMFLACSVLKGFCSISPFRL